MTRLISSTHMYAHTHWSNNTDSTYIPLQTVSSTHMYAHTHWSNNTDSTIHAMNHSVGGSHMLEFNTCDNFACIVNPSLGIHTDTHTHV